MTIYVKTHWVDRIGQRDPWCAVQLMEFSVGLEELGPAHWADGECREDGGKFGEGLAFESHDFVFGEGLIH